MAEEEIRIYWDDALFKPMAATIRGTYYNTITQDELDEELYNIAVRAVNTFKFPRISLDYTTFYAIRDDSDENILNEVAENTEDAVPHGYFTNEVTSKEIEVLIAWMKVYWIENLLSTTDDFENVYTDSNIKTYSRANLIAQNMTRYKEFLAQAHEMETRYSRVFVIRTATLGEVNEED